MTDIDPDGLIGHIHDDVLGDVLVLRKAHLPTMDPAAAAEWLRNQGVSGMAVGTIVKARMNGDLQATAVGRTYLFSEHDLLDWVQSLRGVDKFAARREATRAHYAARGGRR
ncbi:helix-turn-helix domain-containing protein [Mycolicibacterium fortuitum]|uniref:helix-turn-helix domain-containing protein n=1 Tax=Mycolicibacterium fortuitum TaxID=1766 RepID=UPI000B1784CB|nr:helix-turn-helix domain-containing protein [Mycolicibacterium fortuitum]NOQ62527.1 helix-turn-helix domain-containing protein [Mycolicibacterium fortuitum]